MGKVLAVLNELRARSGAHAALVVSPDGLVLDSSHEGDVACDALAASAASHVISSQQLGDDVQFGVLDAVIVIYQERALLMAPVGGAVLVLVGAVGQLGNLRLQHRRNLGALAAALQEELSDGMPDSPAAHDGAAAQTQAAPAPARQATARTSPAGSPSKTGAGLAGNLPKR